MTEAAATSCPHCREVGRHHRLCPDWLEQDRRARAKVLRADQVREDRAAGRRSVPSAAWALRWYFSTRMSWGSARGLALDPEHEGSGRPNRGLDDPKRRLFAVLAGAIKAAEADDQQRNPARPAPFMRWQRVRASPQRIEDQDTGWLCQHFGTGRAYTWIAESEGWTELEVSTRVERALRVVRDRLREGGWLEGGDGG